MTCVTATPYIPRRLFRSRAPTFESRGAFGSGWTVRSRRMYPSSPHSTPQELRAIQKSTPVLLSCPYPTRRRA
eukprot:scaffold149_cov315-Pinguiococcus_pyrenoidosus.AAC.93